MKDIASLTPSLFTAVSKMLPPFEGQPGDSVGLQITGTVHLFADDGSRIASTTATLHPSAVEHT